MRLRNIVRNTIPAPVSVWLCIRSYRCVKALATSHETLLIRGRFRYQHVLLVVLPKKLEPRQRRRHLSPFLLYPSSHDFAHLHSDSGDLSGEALELLCREWGHTKSGGFITQGMWPNRTLQRGAHERNIPLCNNPSVATHNACLALFCVQKCISTTGAYLTLWPNHPVRR